MKGLFPFKFLENNHVPMMKIIMKYFTCGGQFSKFYTYHIRILMNFTRVRLLNISYYLFKSFEKMDLLSK